MKRIAVIAGVLGLTLFGGLVAYSGAEDVAKAVAAAGWATLIVVAIRAVLITGAAIAWHLLYPASIGLRFRITLLVRFIRDAANQLLPIGQVGGDVLGARLVTFWGVPGPLAGAVTVADLAVQAASQVVFALIGVGLLLWSQGDGAVVRYAFGGVAIAAVLVGAFFVVQARLGERLLSGLLRRLGWGHLAAGLIASFWTALETVYADPSRIALSTFLHLVVWLFGTLEVYVVLHAMGYPITFAEALVIESLGQAVRGAAFAVPGGLGVQEGGFIALCALFGIPAGAALGLSLVKRVPEIVLSVPFLLVWQVIEARHAFRSAPTGKPHP